MDRMNLKYRFAIAHGGHIGWIARISWTHNGEKHGLEYALGHEFPDDFGKAVFEHLIRFAEARE